MDVAAYLEWIGFGGRPSPDLATLTALQRLHMTSVPFENLHITQGIHLTTDPDAAYDKIVCEGRGGWCFELNGSFALLLEAIGFEVRRLGAAVLLAGPNTVIEHLALEVTVDQTRDDTGDQTGDRAYLVDVGFGNSFIQPLALNRAGPQDGGNGTYELIGSPQGTTLTKHVDGLPSPEYRYKRVALTMDQFTAVSDSMQVDPDKHWRSKPFATRLLDGGPDRVTLTQDRLKVVRDDATTETAVDPDDWDRHLRQWFGFGSEPYST